MRALPVGDLDRLASDKMSMTRYQCSTCEAVFTVGDSTCCRQCGQVFAPDAADAGPLGAPGIRAIGALGPPPPYRPIVQAPPAFGRGPAPDLEPWRVASLARRPVQPPPDAVAAPESVDPAEDEWSLHREPAPVVERSPPAADDNRFERPADFGPRDRPIPWVPEPPVSRMTLIFRRILPVGGLGRGRHRPIRPSI
jgi:hypothetical protein